MCVRFTRTPKTLWTDPYLHADRRLADAPATEADVVSFSMRVGRASFLWDVLEDIEITGPMALRLFVELRRAEDVYLFVGVQKLRAGHVVPFEGSYGYGFDRVSTGWLKASLRKLDPDHSTPWRPVHTYDEIQPLKPGEVVPVNIALLPSATFFRDGSRCGSTWKGTGSRAGTLSSASGPQLTNTVRKALACSTAGVVIADG